MVHTAAASTARTARGLGLAVALVLCAACSPIDEVFQCASDAQCRNGTVCSDHECVPKPTESSTTAAESGEATASCRRDEDCPTDPCLRAICDEGACKGEPVEAGFELPRSEQKPGDCRVLKCDGQGSESAEPDDMDRPEPDDNPCRERACSNGESQTTPKPDGETCRGGGVCSGGECVNMDTSSDCTVGAACELNMLCQTGKVASCGPLVCKPQPLDGTQCNEPNAPAKVCKAGVCTDECAAGSCSSAARTALVNGDFAQGLMGWTLTDDATKFSIQQDSANDSRLTLSTLVGDRAAGGETATGTVSQRFTVPNDALAVRFVVSGGHGHVRLRDDSKALLEDVTGNDTSDVRIPVTWDLSARRGQALTLAIEDDNEQASWNFVATTGFDVIRDAPSALQNPQFAARLDSWQQDGDARYFYVWDDYCFTGQTRDPLSGVEGYGKRRSVSTYVRATDAPRYGPTAIGTLWQSFVVPDDAIALRFQIHGGMAPRVALFEDSTMLYSKSARTDNYIKLPTSWDLTKHRGKTLTLKIIDDATGEDYDFIGTSGFDLITGYNGP